MANSHSFKLRFEKRHSIQFFVMVREWAKRSHQRENYWYLFGTFGYYLHFSSITRTHKEFVKDSVHRLKLSTTLWRQEEAHGAHLTKGSWPHEKLDKGKNRVNRRLCSELGCPFCDSIVSEMSDLYTTNIYPPNIPRLVYLRVKGSRCP